MMNGRGEICGTQLTGSRRGPLMITVEMPAATARSGAKPIVRFMFASSGAYEPPEPWSAQTRAKRSSSAPAIEMKGTPRLTPIASIRLGSMSERFDR